VADVRPFRGLRFNPRIAGDMSNVVCPPYDVISPKAQKELYQRSHYNVVRLEEGERKPTDSPTNNRYTRAAATLKQWIEKQVLVRDDKPAYYLISHSFQLEGVKRRRLGLMAAVRLEEYEKRVVLPHEFTQRAAKEDRLALMQACHTNFSHIMLLYRDKERHLAPIFRKTMAGTPAVSFSDGEGNNYAFWLINDASVVKQIQSSFASKPLYIADGHHRYETALAYRNLHPDATRDREAAVNFVMTYLVDFDDPGLVVLPYHRVVGGLDMGLEGALWKRLDEVFAAIPWPMKPGASADSLVKEIGKRGKDEMVLGLVKAKEGDSLLRVKPGALPANIGPMASFEAWALEELVLKPVLGSTVDQHVTWIHDATEALELLKSGGHQAAFLLKPMPMDLFEAIVNRGDKLPRKSTFFYPKLPTGLAINVLEGKL
jgi:uncharacterized protein (DUF1015 family)